MTVVQSMTQLTCFVVSTAMSFNCNEFHHSSKNCRGSCTCPRCGSNHPVKDCKATKLSCPNCLKLKNRDSGVNIEHAAWDVTKCRAYTLACDKMRKDILST